MVVSLNKLSNNMFNMNVKQEGHVSQKIEIQLVKEKESCMKFLTKKWCFQIVMQI